MGVIYDVISTGSGDGVVDRVVEWWRGARGEGYDGGGDFPRMHTKIFRLNGGEILGMKGGGGEGCAGGRGVMENYSAS